MRNGTRSRQRSLSSRANSSPLARQLIWKKNNKNPRIRRNSSKRRKKVLFSLLEGIRTFTEFTPNLISKLHQNVCRRSDPLDCFSADEILAENFVVALARFWMSLLHSPHIRRRCKTGGNTSRACNNGLQSTDLDSWAQRATAGAVH